MNKIFAMAVICLNLVSSVCFAGNIPVGVNLELSGKNAYFGNEVMKGIDLALEEINNAGGINNNLIVLHWKDNQSSIDLSKSCAEELITQDKVAAIIGPISSLSTIKAAEATEWLHVPQITPVGSNPRVTKDSNGGIRQYTFTTNFLDPDQGAVMAKFAINHLNARRVVVLFDSTSQYSTSLNTTFTSSFMNSGGEVLANLNYQQNQSDFMNLLLQIKSYNPDALYLPGFYQEAGPIIAQIRRLGISIPILGGDGFDSPRIVSYAGYNSLNNTYITHSYISDNNDPLIKQFQSAFMRKYGEVPNAFSVLGYDTLMLLYDAMKRSRSFDSESIKNALESTRNARELTGPISIRPDHTTEKSIFIIEYVNGNQTFKQRMRN